MVTIVLAGEAVGLEQIVDRIWRLSYRWRALCFVDLRSGSPRVMAEPEAENLLKEVDERTAITDPQLHIASRESCGRCARYGVSPI